MEIDNQCIDPMNNNKDCRVGQLTTKLLATKQQLRFSCRAEVEDFFKRMDRDYDGRLSFGEFMGEETPLEKVNIFVFISISIKVCRFLKIKPCRFSRAWIKTGVEQLQRRSSSKSARISPRSRSYRQLGQINRIHIELH